MSELEFGNIPVVSTDKEISLLTKLYVKAIKNKVEFKSLPSVMLHGAPGVGKSQSVEQIAKNITNETGKSVNITQVRLLLFNPVDLRGIPSVNEDRTLAVWLKPKIFDMNPSKDVVNILFLDEITAAPTSVQAAAYQLTLDREVGEHKLPENTIVICAGNRITDKSVAYQMPKALCNRMLHLEISINAKTWINWAVEKGIHPYVTGFLRFKPDYLYKNDNKPATYAFCTPRSWEMVSNVLNNISDNMTEVYDLIAGLVGKGVALELKSWAKVYSELPSIQDIFDGKETMVPEKPDILYALISSMTAYARTVKDDMEKIENSIEYVSKLPNEFSLLIMRDYSYIGKDFKLKLLKIPAYAKWLKGKGELLYAANN